ncbi:transcription factor Sox-9-B-like isoform X2 [Biomphalaria glabrata]|uniref:Transcription factor Sox-9-B-like isoform X2 n=1 Tax=Biomphalaria glabrata TaxID=6526 RepID=A0A2C9M8H1_BIOGL|nr:transcription factor Sox-9-B-like isoform X2 [Biomphalaria glabrata]KAI8739437.1 transcription factor Sox-9-B-like isoform X2 [Biomphalaria glabrata]
MDTGDGDLQVEDDLKKTAPILSRIKPSNNGQPDGGTGDGNNNTDSDGDTTDGAPPHLEADKIQNENAGAKRKHIQSRRMKEYQQQLTTNSSNRQERTCHVCGRVYTSGPGFRYHVKMHSPNIESFTCHLCNKTFKSANGLKYHKKRKRCRGGHPSTTAGSSSAGSSSKLDSIAHERLLYLANIATGPQSPLLQGSGERSSSTFFNDSETSAVMALSSMKKKCCDVKKADKPTTSLHPPESQKPKRPMNGFMLFAQRYRAELNKKHPDMNNRMISGKLSELWKKLQENERQHWKEEARLKAEQFQKVYPNCWKRKK